jgi:hypothetical protein
LRTFNFTVYALRWASLIEARHLVCWWSSLVNSACGVAEGAVFSTLYVLRKFFLSQNLWSWDHSATTRGVIAGGKVTSNITAIAATLLHSGWLPSFKSWILLLHKTSLIIIHLYILQRSEVTLPLIVSIILVRLLQVLLLLREVHGAVNSRVTQVNILLPDLGKSTERLNLFNIIVNNLINQTLLRMKQGFSFSINRRKLWATVDNMLLVLLRLNLVSITLFHIIGLCVHGLWFWWIYETITCICI